MSGFSLRYPYFIVVCCLIACVVGVSALLRMPVDLFPEIKIPTVVVATFYSGMPAEQVEASITAPSERFFTLGSGIDHIESESLPGVSLIKITFQPGVNPDAAASGISNLALANLRSLPRGTLPPVVLKFDASSLPVCLITLKAKGMNESQLRDIGQFTVRNQLANIPGASIPPPFGGRYRQIMVYVDPLKLEANQLSVMDVVRSINESNLILPAGDVKVGPLDYSIFTNSQLNTIQEINAVPLKTVGSSSVTVGDVGQAKDGTQIQYNIVRVDGQDSVYLPVLKQGGDSNTIAIVDGVKATLAQLLDAPKELVAKVVFDQSNFVKQAIENLLHEGAIGLGLTGVMILIFLGSLRATLGVFFSIPLSVMATFIALGMGGNSVNSMILGGLALAFSRLIDNSVVVLENIFRHMEEGASPAQAAEVGGREVALPVLAATLTTAIVFFPVTFLAGVSRYLFGALALSVVLALFASYVVAMTVVPLFCARFIHGHGHGEGRFTRWFNAKFEWLLARYDHWVGVALRKPGQSLTLLLGLCVLSIGLYPLLGFAYFPRTDPGQFTINIKAPSGTRVEETRNEVAKIEAIIEKMVPENERDVILSNIGINPNFSSLYTSNTASHTAFIQVSLKEGHKGGSYAYMDALRREVAKEVPEVTAYFQAGGLVDAVVNMGMPAPMDIQVSGSDLQANYQVAAELAKQIRGLAGVSDVFIPQDVDAPAYKLEVNRIHASELHLSQQEIIGNVVTALVSNQMLAPSYWNDPKTGNPYLFTVQYPEGTIQSLNDLKAIPIRGAESKEATRLDNVMDVKTILSPSVVSHYQIRRVVDVYVASKSEDLSRVAAAVNNVISKTKLAGSQRITMRGAVEAMHQSFSSFGLGLLMAVVLVYLVLVAQFKSFMDPLIILLAVPPGLSGVLITLLMTGTTMNVMSLMGVVMLVGIVVSNSILIVEFTHRLLERGAAVNEAVAVACRVRLRPVLMTSLATIIGLIPMALALGAGSEAYAPLARAIIGGLTVSLVMTVFIVPVAFSLVYQRRQRQVGMQEAAA